MSILKKLKKINSNNAAQLFEKHPLANESLEFRLQYLASVAMVCAIDREPTNAERQAFSGLAVSLSVDEPDAIEQMNERNSINEDDIPIMFDAITTKNADWIYLLDLAWIHIADGTLEKLESETIQEIVELLNIDVKDIPPIQAFASAIRNRDFAGAVRQTPFFAIDSGLHELMPELLGFQRFKTVEIIRNKKIEKNINTNSISSSFFDRVFSDVDFRQYIEWEKEIGDFVKKDETISSFIMGKTVRNTEKIKAPFTGVIATKVIMNGNPVKEGEIVGTLYRTEFDD